MYASLDDLIAAYGEDEIRQLSDRNRNNAVDESVVDAAIASAQAEVEDYLRGRVEVPFPDDAVPPTVKRAVIKMARFHLYRDPTDTVRMDYKDALGTLKDIQAGKMVLAANAQQTTSSVPRIKRDEPNISDHDLNLYKEPSLNSYG